MQKYSKLFGKTVREAKSEMTAISHKLLYQAGFIRESVAGRFYFLPLGMRVKDKVINIVQKEMDKAGAQKMITPILHPIELWEETNRTNSVGFELMTIKDRREAEFALGGTAEEMFVDLARKFQVSYKDLPFNLYQFGQKFRDELRARGGLLRAREFLMKDAYSFHADEKDFAKEYENMSNVYSNITSQIGLEAKKVAADNGYIGGEYCHEYIVDTEVGESTYFVTKSGNYAMHEDIATFTLPNMNIGETEKELKMVDAKRGTTMEDGEKFHNLPLWQQIKDVVYKNDRGEYILAIIRGDLDVNETKLKNVSKSITLEMATDEQVQNDLNSERGFISPVKIKEGLAKNVKLLIVADNSLSGVKNMYGGANQKNKDYINININRDFKSDLTADIANAKEGFKTTDGEELIKKKGVEVGNIFQLGYHYSHKMKGATFTDKDGKQKPYYMGCYGFGIGRSMATVVEIHNDEKGIIWPKNITPFNVHFISLGEDLNGQAEEIIKQIEGKGFDVLWDERDIGAGEKFADADLIGIPLRVVLSKRSLEAGGLELKIRSEKEAKIIDKTKLLEFITEFYL